MHALQVYLANGLCRPGRARAFGDEARHSTKMKWDMLCRPVGPEAKPGHGPVAFKRVMSCQWPVGPYRVGSARSPDIQNMVIFPINLVILIKKLFNVTKFELKNMITLNNIIKYVLLHFY
jgi:hypothetical protein